MKQRRGRRWFAPEVVQTSAMDCGPATLKCLLDGHGIGVSYGRLREACQTDVDGTTIDTLEEIAIALGLDAEQVMVPPDHVLLTEAHALPAIAVVRLPSGTTHFVVLWRQYGRFLEVMDPATGRRWTTRSALLDELYVHEMPVPAADWREFAASDDFLRPLRQRLDRVGCAQRPRERVIANALADPGWQGLARLDAAVRLVESLCQAGALRRDNAAQRLLDTVLTTAKAGEADAIPASNYSVRVSSGEMKEGVQLLMRGAVLVRCKGRRADAVDTAALAPELAAALGESRARPFGELWGLMRADGALVATGILIALLAAAACVILEATLFRGFLDLGDRLEVAGQRLAAGAAVLLLLGALLLLDGSLGALLWRSGRRLELRLRAAFLAKIPQLSDRHFHSRLTSDMAERAHLTHVLRMLPDLGGQFLRTVLELVFTALAIAWLDPASAIPAMLAAALAIAIPLTAQPLLQGRDLKMRTHTGALTRFYLDALLGSIPIRAHVAADTMRREHESLLVEWARAGFALQRSSTLVDLLQLATGFALGAYILAAHRGATDFPAALLLLYWALKLPLLGQEAASLARQYPGLRNVTLRLLEPLGAEGASNEPSSATLDGPCAVQRGAAVDMASVDIRAGGHVVLNDIELHIAPGEHVAIVGQSGAGKSSLLGLLLGWHRPASGKVLIDGQILDSGRLDRLRSETAWVDPAVQLWNRSLYTNLRYGADDVTAHFAPILAAADLKELLQQLPDGLQTSLGEGGALVSGGEGQRVRLGRAMARANARLVLLDEPFRGLARGQRSHLLARAREWWQHATLLLVTHDIEDSAHFDRVLVVEAGRIVEDGVPARLAGSLHSRYGALMAADAEARAGLWGDSDWRRWWLADGMLEERRAQ